MTVKELIEKLLGYEPDMEVYYSTGSSMDNRMGHTHLVHEVFSESQPRGLATDHPSSVYVVVLEGI